MTTIDIDQDITGAAGRSLAGAGYRHVRAVCADGYPADGPYDRIIVTAGARDLPAAWWRQLTRDGWIVVPLTVHGSGLTRSIAFGRPPAGHRIPATPDVGAASGRQLASWITPELSRSDQ